MATYAEIDVDDVLNQLEALSKDASDGAHDADKLEDKFNALESKLDDLIKQLEKAK